LQISQENQRFFGSFISINNSKNSFPCVKNSSKAQYNGICQKPLTRKSHELNEKKSRIKREKVNNRERIQYSLSK